MAADVEPAFTIPVLPDAPGVLDADALDPQALFDQIVNSLACLMNEGAYTGEIECWLQRMQFICKLADIAGVELVLPEG